MASFLNKSNLPLGMRQNNPGNLRPLNGGELWEGEIRPGGKRPAFSFFKDMAFGLRGMITDVTGKIVNRKLNTLRKLIHVYAPPHENNTTRYIQIVSDATGLKPDQQIPVTYDTLDKIIRTKIQVEQGKKFYDMIPDQDFTTAYQLLDPKVKNWLGIKQLPASNFNFRTPFANLFVNRSFKYSAD